MTEHLTDAMLEAYRAKRFGVSELLALDDHLAGCSACRGRLGSGQGEPVWSALAAAREAGETHLTYEQVSAFVDRTLPPGERGAAERHLETCESCEREVADLRAFASQLERAPIPIRRRSLWTWGGTAAIAATLVLAAVLWKPGPRNDSPAPAPAPVARLTFNDASGRMSLLANGRLNGPGAPSDPDVSHLVAEALETGRLGLKIPSAVSTKRSVLLGREPEAQGFRVLSPQAEVVSGGRPVLQWDTLPGASSYQVQIFDAEYRPVAESPILRTTTWQTTRPLRRGQVFAWQVTALRNGERIIAPRTPQPEARFQILDEASAARIEAARNSPSKSHLALAATLAAAGARAEALLEIDELARLNPGLPLVESLRKSLQ